MGLYKIPDPDELDPASLSLCVACAKEPHLKRFVKANVGARALCGICLRPEGSDVCALDRKLELTNLIKALMRFHYDETDYNPHWGGEYEPSTLLYRENPILHDETNLFFTRGPEIGCVFLDDLFGAEPYPDPATGISIYAGFDEHHGRLLNRAIGRGQSMRLFDLRRRLQGENYFDVEPAVRKILDAAGPRVARAIPTGQSYFRARIGARRFHKIDGEGPAFKAYEAEQLGAPPPPTATSGRLNRAGVSFLYLATNHSTAAAEIRPHPSHILSIGEFAAVRDLKVAAFDVDITAFVGSEADLALYDFLFSADKAMSLPVPPEEVTRYSITQLIADAVRLSGFDGLTFRSSVEDGQNLCVFDPAAFKYVEGSAMPTEVKSLHYQLGEVAVVPAERGDHYYSADI